MFQGEWKKEMRWDGHVVKKSRGTLLIENGTDSWSQRIFHFFVCLEKGGAVTAKGRNIPWFSVVFDRSTASPGGDLSEVTWGIRI